MSSSSGQLRYERLRRTINKQTLAQIVRGVLKGVIHDHGPIEDGNDINSAAKRIAAQIVAHAEKNFMKQEEEEEGDYHGRD